MSVFFHLSQHTVATETRAAKDDVAQLRAQIEEQQRQIDSLTLASQAMWELLRGAAQLADADLMEKMQEVDLRDGEADGKITSTIVGCPKCGRRSRSARRQCVYCGETLPTHSAFARPSA